MKKRILFFTVASLLFVAGALTPFLWKKTMNMKTSYRLKEPMLISSSNGAPYYMIPTNTVLHFEKGFAEGHQLYKIEVFFKGKLPADQLSPDAAAESTWLYQLDADDISKVLHQYPLSKEDLVQIMKARKMTRDDLAQIVREWKDD
jgi:hypothetical protein